MSPKVPASNAKPAGAACTSTIVRHAPGCRRGWTVSGARVWESPQLRPRLRGESGGFPTVAARESRNVLLGGFALNKLNES